MRILILADVHANYDGLLALQSAERSPDALLFLGDAVGYGPDPAACISWLRRNVTLAVRGDHDEAIVTANFASTTGASEDRDLAEATLEHTARLLSPADKRYLTSLPLTAQITLGGVTFFLAHVRPGDPLGHDGQRRMESGNGKKEGGSGKESLAASFPFPISNTQSPIPDILLVSHTHIPTIRLLRVEGRQFYAVNPGSLGQPRHGLPSITYAVWEDGDLAIRHIDYDPTRVCQRLTLWPLEPEQCDRLQRILQTGL